MAAGTHPAAYEARPTWALPNSPAATASNGAFSLYRDALARNHAYAAATSTLAQALLASIGPENKVSLEATFDPDPLYSLTPRQIVDAMFAEHGTTNPQDLAVLRAPLHEPLPALANLERHMNFFLLASKKLTTADQGKTPYEYFEIFLETLKGSPVVGQCLPANYAVNTTMATRNLGTLYPYLKSQLEFFLIQSTASPFSGAAIPAPKPKNKNKKKKGAKGGQIPKWGPYGRAMYAAAPPNFASGIFEAAVTPSSNLQEAHAEIHRLHQVMAQQGNLSAAYSNFGHAVQHTLPPTVPSAHFVQNFGDRSRPHYCYVHGFNISHDGPACRVMGSDPRYTAAMKAATTPVGTGGNPNVGPPVSLPFRFSSPPVCLPCLFSTSPTKDNSKPPAPNDETASARLATCVALTIRGENHPSRTRVDGPQPLPSPLSNLKPLPSHMMSRFSALNPFSSFISDSESDISGSESDDEEETSALPSHPLDASNLPVTSPQPFLSLLCPTVLRSPMSLPAPMSALSSAPSSCSSPLIADSGCTSILIQMANFPPLSILHLQASTTSPLHSPRWQHPRSGHGGSPHR